MDIGKKIRIARKIRGLSQTQLASKIGVTKQTISQYENNQIHIPDNKIEKIAKILKKEIDFFVTPDIKDSTPIKNINEDLNKIFSYKLRTIRLKYGYSIQDIADKLNMSYNRYNAYETLKSIPPVKIAKKIAKIFGVSVGYFLGEDEVQEVSQAKTMKYIPVLGEVKAGNPLKDNTSTIESMLPLPSEVVKGKHITGAFKVISDSMEPKFPVGAFVLVDNEAIVQQGDIAFVYVIDEGTTLKEVRFFKNNIKLIPANEKYEPKLYKPEEVHILGKVVGSVKYEI